MNQIFYKNNANSQAVLAATGMNGLKDYDTEISIFILGDLFYDAFYKDVNSGINVSMIRVSYYCLNEWYVFFCH